MDPTKQDGSGDRKNISLIKAGSELVEKRLVRVPMARRGFGTRGNKVPILTNHFKVNASKLDGYFFHYSVALSFEDGHPVDGKGIGRKLLERVHEMYAAELDGKNFAYDGEKSLFTIGPLPQNKLEFTVVLEDVTSGRNTGKDSPEQGALNESDRKRFRRAYRSKTYKVEINFAAKIPMQAIVNALHGQESENTQEAIRVFDIILRQRAAKQGCLLVRQSFFHNDPRNFVEVGGGVHGCRGFHSSFRTSQNGLSLNVDVTTTMTIQPGPVANFLVVNQNVKDPSVVDWAKAKRTLKNLRVKTKPTNQEHKITGLSERSCREQTFTLKQKGNDGDGETEITVYDYFVKHHNINLRYSANLPCINVGKPKRPIYFPIELCELVSLQRYTKALSTFQRASLVEKSRQKPNERKSALINALKTSNYGADEMLKAAGVSINPSFMQVDGRVLPTPKLKVGNHEDLFARNGRWNFNNKRLINACEIKNWAVVNFSARCDVRALIRDLMKVARMKGVKIEEPNNLFNENPQLRQAPALVRVEKMLEQIKPTISRDSNFFLCLLPERKNCDIYGPWKRRLLSDIGVVTQCLSPTRLNDQYLTNLLLKINAKLGGLNSALASEVSRSVPMVSEVPTLILGMDVSHGSPGQNIPSIAAVVSSRDWPSISRYRACVRTQSPKVEMIDSLFKQVSDTEDRGIIRELLLDFYYSSRQRKPEQIIIFRDGVSESQFGQVLNIELNQIVKAWKFLETSTLLPKFVVVVAQKNHHTRFFQADSPDNVQPGTIIDNKICHPRNNDFYLCAHAGMIGTTRPTHYHVLLDEVGFSADDLQELVHSLSYVYQRSTTAISVVAPICYAHLAAAQLGQWMKSEDNSETASRENLDVPAMPKLHRDVESSMFFC